MDPYYSDESVTLYHGDALEVLRTMPDQSVDCCVTSPPYFGLRDYGEEGQYGLESSPAEYVETMRALFSEVRRVLSDDGTLWLNIGDSYSGYHGNKRVADDSAPSNKAGYWENMRQSLPGGIGPKNLLGIPWRTAFALQDDGWILRNDIIWAKPNAMPESVTDRLSTRHEHLFMLSKSQRYWFDLDPIREVLAYPNDDRILPRAERGEPNGQQSQRARMGAVVRRADRTNYPEGVRPQTQRAATGVRHQSDFGNGGRNPGDVWAINTQPFSEAHFAVMPRELARRAIVAGCKPGGVVLDPFSGSGTTGLVAGQNGRRYVGIDLNRDYLDLSLRTRLAQSAFIDFGEVS